MDIDTAINQIVNYLQDNQVRIEWVSADTFLLLNFKLGVEVTSLSKMDNEYSQLTKINKAAENQITLFQFFQDEVINKLSIVQSRILRNVQKNPLPSISAHKCNIEEISNEELEIQFCNANHLFSAPLWRDKCYAARLPDGSIVGMIWIKFMPENVLDIVRFCVDISGPQIYGLFTKMIRFAVVTEKFNGKVITLSNVRLGNGRLASASGFTYEQTLSPKCYVTDGTVREELNKRTIAGPAHLLWDAGAKVWSANYSTFLK